MKVHIPKIVAEVREFYKDLLAERHSYPSIGAHLEAMAQRMWEGVQARKEFVYHEIANYHRDHLGREVRQLQGEKFTLEDCRQAIANEYGYNRWRNVVAENLPYDSDFEEAVDDLLNGDLKALRDRAARKPALLNQSSRYGHGATLLHYAASNGVEFWRQMVPMNLPEQVDYLLAQGASLKAKMQVYGGEYTAPELLLSSMHPRNAGIFDELRASMGV